MPVVGVWEMVVILVAVLMFGPKRIPQIARQIGSMVAQLRRASDEFMRELTKEPVEEPDGIEVHDEPAAGEDEVEVPSLTGQQIREAASRLGVDTEGKSDEEVRSEMMERIYSSPVSEGEKPGSG